MMVGLSRYSSAARIISVVLLILALGLTLISAYFLRQLELETRQTVLAQQFSTISLLADRIDRVVAEQIVVLEGISRQLVAGDGLRPAAEIRAALDARIHLKRVFNGGLLVQDLDATVRLDSPQLPGRPGSNLVDSHHVQQVFARGEPGVGPPFTGGLPAGGFMLPISVPILSENGRPRGLLTGLVDLAAPNFINREAGYNYGKSGGFLVVDPAAGLVIAATESERIAEVVPQPGINLLHDRFMAGDEGSGIAYSSGALQLGSGKQIPAAGWFAVARLPMAEAMAPLRMLQQRLLVGALGVLLVGGALLAWFIKRQLDPLVEYAATLDDMTGGRIPTGPLPEGRRDELGRLLRSFNHLLGSLRAAEEKFRGIAETSSDLIFRIDTRGRVTYCSPAVKEIMALAPEEVVGRDFIHLIDPADIGRTRQAFTSPLKGGSVRNLELNLRRGDGSIFAGEISAVPIREQGGVVGVQGVLRDISVRRQAALDLAQQFLFQKMVADIATIFVKSRGREFDVAVESALRLSGDFFMVDRVSLFIFSADRRTMKIDREWRAPGVPSQRERIQGVPLNRFAWLSEQLRREPFVHLPEIDRLPPEAAAEWEELTAREIKSALLLPLSGLERQPGFIAYEMVARSRVWSDTEIVALKVVAEVMAAALVRYAMEEELRRLSAELARSNADLTDFAAIASHDLQEPLRKVVTFGDRLQLKYGSVLDEKGADYLARMQGAAERMQGLIDDLLQYSRVNSRGEEFEPVDLMELLAEVQDSLEQPIRELEAKIDVEPLPELLADRGQIHSLFQNLLGNALKYHRPEGRPEIRIWPAATSDRTVTIALSDNGIGFDNRYLDRIFRPFQRLHGQGQYRGSGIGLAICKKIVERHGGEISGDGTSGTGATFTVRLPLLKG